MSSEHDRRTQNSSVSSAAANSNAERSAETRQSNSIVMSSHTLMDAVTDGTIADHAAFCGLSPNDIKRLVENHADAKLLVRLRNAQGDGRAFMSVKDIHRWRDSNDTIVADLRLWHYDDIRDVFPARNGA